MMELNNFKQIKQTNELLSEQVAERLQGFIIEMHLKAGEKLPNEFELAKTLDVGRGSIREAIKLLEARNVLEIKRGRGTYITENPGVTDDPFGFAFWEDEDRLTRELYVLRWQLEPWIAGLAAESAKPEDLTELKDHQHKVEELIQNGQDHLLEDQRFHTCIANCTHNRVLPMLIPVITYSVQLLGLRNLGQETIESHAKIVEAIVSHDPPKAQYEMKEHLRWIWQTLPPQCRVDLESL